MRPLAKMATRRDGAAMTTDIALGFIVVAAVLPALLYGIRSRAKTDSAFWILGSLACIGPAYAAFVRSHGEWQIDFASTIWVTMAATAGIFLIFSMFVRGTWRLVPLFAGYLMVLGVFGIVWQHTPAVPIGDIDGNEWLVLHIGLAVVTYALVTLSAIAAFAAFTQERALKNKSKPLLEGRLPAITDCDRLVTLFLTIGEIILGLGIVSGAALNLAAGQSALTLDHKTIFTLGSFAIMGILLIAQAKSGLRGRRAARIVLLAHLLLTLGYPGVKFVTDVLLP